MPHKDNSYGPQTAVNIDVVVVGDDDVTIATAELLDSSGQFLTNSIGTARRRAFDRRRQSVGLNLATARAIRKIADRLERDALAVVAADDAERSARLQKAFRRSQVTQRQQIQHNRNLRAPELRKQRQLTGERRYALQKTEALALDENAFAG